MSDCPGCRSDVSRRPSWNCSDCGHQLGEVVCGAIRVWAPQPLVGEDETAVECPRCHRVNTWRHKVETMTP